MKKLTMLFITFVLTLSLTACASDKEIDAVVGELMITSCRDAVVDPEDGVWNDYLEVKDAAGFEKELNARITELGAETETGQGQGTFKQLCSTAKALEILGYEKESTKEAFAKAMTASMETRFSQYGARTLVSDANEAQNLSFYTKPLELMSASKLLSVESIIKNMQLKKEEAIKSGNVGKIMHYASEVRYILDKADYLQASDLLTVEEFWSAIADQAEPAVVENGLGGYYDSQQNKYQDKSTKQDLVGAVTGTPYGEGGISVRNSSYHYYYGDFMNWASYETFTDTSGEMDDLGKSYLEKAKTSDHGFDYKGNSFSGGNCFASIVANGCLLDSNTDSEMAASGTGTPTSCTVSPVGHLVSDKIKAVYVVDDDYIIFWTDTSVICDDGDGFELPHQLSGSQLDDITKDYKEYIEVLAKEKEVVEQ